MTIAAVGGQLGGAVADSTTQVSRAFGSNVTAGSLIIVVCEKFANAQDVFIAGDCTMSAGTATLDTIVLDKQVSVEADTGQWVHTGIWSSLVTGTGSCTMQVAGAVTGSYLHIATGEFTGSFNSSRLEASNSNSTTSDSTTAAGTGNGTSAGAAMSVAGVAINSGSNITLTEDAAFSLIAEEPDGSAHVVGSAIYRIVTGGTTDEGSWTIGSANTGWCAALAVYAEVPSTQTTYPTSDHTDGTWTPSTGTDNYAVVDDVTDTEYTSTTSNSTLRLNLGSLSTPAAGTRTLSVRAAGSTEKKLVVRLIENTTTVQTFTHDPIQDVVGIYDEVVTGSITNYGDLDVECEIADATTAPTPTVSYGAIGTAGTTTNTTSHNVNYPSMTGYKAGTALYLIATGRSNTAGTEFAVTGGGWTNLGTLEGGTGTWTADTGTRRVTIFKKDSVSGSESGTITVTLSGTTANTLFGSIVRVDPPANNWTLSESFGSGADTTHGTGYSATSGTSLSWQQGDLLLYAMAGCTDTLTSISAQSISASGATFTRTNRRSTAVTGGNDHRHYIETATVDTGSSSSAPVHSFTVTSSQSGPTAFLRIRATPPTEKGRVTSIKWTIPAAASGGSTVTPGVAALTIAGLAPTVTGGTLLISPGVAALTLSGLAPTAAVTAHQTVTPGVGALTLGGLAPTVAVTAHVFASPGVAALTLAGLAPTIARTDHQRVTPGVAALTITGLAPTVASVDAITVAPPSGALTLTGLAPAIARTEHQSVAPGVAALTVAGQVPTIARTEHATVAPGIAALTLTALAPSAVLTQHITSSPGAAAITLSGLAPQSVLTEHHRASPGVAALTIAGLAPQPVVSEAGAIFVPAAALTLTGRAPVALLTEHQRVTPAAAILALAGLAPTAVVTANQTAAPGVAELTLSGLAPSVALTAHQVVSPGAAALLLTGFAPQLVVSAALSIVVDAAQLVIAGYAPSVQLIGPPTRFVRETPVLDQNAAGSVVVFMQSSVNHVSGVSGLTLTLSMSKGGGAFAPVTRTVTDVGAGAYSIALTAADTDTVGDLMILAQSAGADDSIVSARVAPEIDAGVTLTEAMRLMLATMAGQAAGFGSALETFYDTAGGKARFSSTVDGAGTRTVTLNDLT